MEAEEFDRMYALEGSHWWFAGKRRAAKALIPLQPGAAASRRILDVGCGTGGMLSQLVGAYGKSCGVDLSPRAIRYARQRSQENTAISSVLALPFACDDFDLVTAFDVLYHQWVGDDSAALLECSRVLKPGGWLLVTDSAFPFLWSHHDEACRARQRYTAAQLRARIEGAGLVVCRLTYFNTLLFPIVAAMRLWSRRFPSDRPGASDLRALPGWLNAILKGVFVAEASLLRWVSYPYGVSVLCLAQKPPHDSAPLASA